MNQDLQTTRVLRSFEDILDDLEALSRQHLLAWRIGAGRVLLRDLFGGEPQAYLSRDSTKEARFARFITEHADALLRYGLTDGTARQSIVGWIVYDALPEHVRKPLFLSQVLELARLSDPTRRAELAVASIENDWTTRQLRDVVSAVNAGLPVDDQLDVPEPVLPPPLQAKVQPGRLVTRVERWAGDVDDMVAQWATVDAKKLRPVQKQRLAAAVAKARERLAKLAMALGG